MVAHSECEPNLRDACPLPLLVPLHEKARLDARRERRRDNLPRAEKSRAGSRDS